MTKKPSECQVGGEHYAKMKIQPKVFCEKNGFGACASDAVGYISREQSMRGTLEGDRGGAKDIHKAIHALRLLLEINYGEVPEAESCPVKVTSDGIDIVGQCVHQGCANIALLSIHGSSAVACDEHWNELRPTSDPLADTGEYQLPTTVLPPLHPEPFRPFAAKPVTTPS